MGILRDDRRATWYDPGKFWSGDYLPISDGWTPRQGGRGQPLTALHRSAAAPTAATAARSSSPPTTVNGNGTPASHSPAYAAALLVVPTSSQPPSGRAAELAERRADPRPHLAGAERRRRRGSRAPSPCRGWPPARPPGRGRPAPRTSPSRTSTVGDPVDAEGAQLVGVVGVAQQVPPAVAHHDRPRVDLERARVAGRRAVADPHLALRGHRRHEVAGHRRVGLGRGALGHGPRGLAQGDRLPRDVARQHPQDLAERRPDRVVGIGDGVLGVERGHHQAERLGRGEDQRREPQAAARGCSRRRGPGSTRPGCRPRAGSRRSGARRAR